MKVTEVRTLHRIFSLEVSEEELAIIEDALGKVSGAECEGSGSLWSAVEKLCNDYGVGRR